jgi:hypothetical protein
VECLNFVYTIGEHEDDVIAVTGKMRQKTQCYFCTGDLYGNQTWYLKNFVTPVNKYSVVEGISIWVADTNGNTKFTYGDVKTSSKFRTTFIESCGVHPQSN